MILNIVGIYKWKMPEKKILRLCFFYFIHYIKKNENAAAILSQSDGKQIVMHFYFLLSNTF